MGVIMDSHVVKSRYGDDRKFTLIDEETLVISGNFAFTRAGSIEDSDDLYFIDFDGGPFVSVGENLKMPFGVFEVYQITFLESKVVLKVIKME